MSKLLSMKCGTGEEYYTDAKTVAEAAISSIGLVCEPA
jgi:chemotaxis methyl-accepting protein methylase